MDLSYCRSQINAYNTKIREYAAYVKDLRTILSNLTNNLDDEINAINSALGNLCSDLDGSVKHSSAFTNNSDFVGEQKEYGVYSVSTLNNASNSIQAEIRRISNLSEQCSDMVTYYQNEYNEEKRRQAEAKKNKN